MLAMTGVLIMIVSFGHFPWISLGVSATWGIDGALKKKLMLDAWVSILLEGLMMMPVALGYVFWLSSIGENHFLPTVNPELSLCLAGTGIVASIPLIFFTIAAVNLPDERARILPVHLADPHAFCSESYSSTSVSAGANSSPSSSSGAASLSSF